jgi:hypothetical protein
MTAEENPAATAIADRAQTKPERDTDSARPLTTQEHRSASDDVRWLSAPQTVASDHDDDRFAAIEEFAEKAGSYWRSIGEAAYRADLRTIETHCRQVRVLTLAVFSTVKGLGARRAA